MNRFTATFIGAAVGLVLPMQLTLADGGNAIAPALLPELTAQWWQWALSIPTGQNPQLDPNGQYCMVGQRGSIWFLGGVFSGGPAERACSVPEGATLFFPVINEITINAPNVCGQGPENDPAKDLPATEQVLHRRCSSFQRQGSGRRQENIVSARPVAGLRGCIAGRQHIRRFLRGSGERAGDDIFPGSG